MEEKKDIQINKMFINIKVSKQKIQDAFAALCKQAHVSGKGDVNDTLLLSYHHCTDDPKVINARALLTTLQAAELEGSISSTNNEKFDLQVEYSSYLTFCLESDKAKIITIKKEITKNGPQN